MVYSGDKRVPSGGVYSCEYGSVILVILRVRRSGLVMIYECRSVFD